MCLSVFYQDIKSVCRSESILRHAFLNNKSILENMRFLKHLRVDKTYVAMNSRRHVFQVICPSVSEMHMLIHLNQKPFNCNQCLQTFRHKLHQILSMKRNDGASTLGLPMEILPRDRMISAIVQNRYVLY